MNQNAAKNKESTPKAQVTKNGMELLCRFWIQKISLLKTELAAYNSIRSNNYKNVEAGSIMKNYQQKYF
jgi:hypothetical protein